ncbi:MAG: DUF4823 domain-containing protein [Gammaproteobacteria bacterium]
MESSMRTLFVSVLAFVVAGCASTYTQDALLVPSGKLTRGKPVVIAMPSDGSYEGKAYPESGRMTADATRAAFAPFTTATVATDCRELECLKSSRPLADGYYVIPEILHWEDRATEWSGKSDRLEIKLSVYGSQGSAELASTVLTGKSKWATFGGDHPQDLLSEPLTTYVNSLY